MTKLSAACALFFAVLGTGAGQSGKHNVTLDDLLSLRSVSGLAIAPDGKQIAYRFNNDLYLTAATGGPPRKLAAGLAPSFSPDGRQLAYYSANDGVTRLCVADLQSGASQVLSNIEGGLISTSAPGWSPDGAQLVVTVTVPRPKAAVTPAPDSSPIVIPPDAPPGLAVTGLFRSTALVRDPPPTPRRRILVVRRDGSPSRAISGEEENAAFPAWSPDGAAVVFVSSGKLVRVDLATAARVVLATGAKEMASPRWSPDGQKIAYLDLAEPFGLFTAAFLAEAKPDPSMPPRNLSRMLDRYVFDVQWSGDGTLIALINDGVNRPIGRLSTGGRFDSVTQGDTSRTMFSVSRNGSIVWVESAPEHYARLLLLRPGSETPEVVFDPNPEIAGWLLGAQRVIRWKNSRGDVLEGIVVLPPNVPQGRRTPLIVDPYSHRWNEFEAIPMLANRYLAAQGYALFLPNHRAFHTFPKSLKGLEYARVSQRPDSADLMADDILLGVDQLVREAIADPERLALYSFSTGASAVDLLLTKTNRFKAAISAGGVADWLHYYLERPSDDATIPGMLEGQTPWDAPELYRALSPVYQADRIHTPLLLEVGDKDNFLLQSVLFYNALRRLGRPVTLVRYPDQAHGFQGDALRDHWRRCLQFLKDHGV